MTTKTIAHLKNSILTAFSAAILIAFSWPTTASATGGRTNAAGCHNSKKAGYHCHGGKAQAKPGAPKKAPGTPPKKKG